MKRPINQTNLIGADSAPTEKKAHIRDEKESREGMAAAVRKVLEHMGEDPDREGLHKTPERYAKALQFFTKGYYENTHEVVNEAIFEVDHRDLVLVRDIDLFSMCEHHMVPFMGKVCWFSSMCIFVCSTADSPRYTSGISPMAAFWDFQNSPALQRSLRVAYRCKSA